MAKKRRVWQSWSRRFHKWGQFPPDSKHQRFTPVFQRAQSILCHRSPCGKKRDTTHPYEVWYQRSFEFIITTLELTFGHERITWPRHEFLKIDIAIALLSIYSMAYICSVCPRDEMKNVSSLQCVSRYRTRYQTRFARV